ncbi:MAG TPA: glycosyltransferase family 4 protein [Patescibacteria group bacterium]|nr:glycosyltransferase family 4 protein [Patescibacteria group bacterium]
MNIGIYDPYLDDLGGGEKYMMTIAACLAENNSVSIFWDNPQDLRDIHERFAVDISQLKLVKNIFSPHVSFWERFFQSKQYDVIIVLSDGSIPLLLTKKVLLHIQQPLEAMQTVTLVDKLKVARIYKFFCNSQYTKSFIDKQFHLQTTVLYPPVALHPRQIKKENIILHVGRFRVANVSIYGGNYKKQDIMIDAFKHMVDNGLKGWNFVLAVSIKERDKEAFATMQMSAKGYPIRFLINQTNEELWDIYSRAKIYWHASGYGEDLEKHPEYAEHFGIATVEAMGAGCVPVVIHAGGQTEIVQDGKNGLLWTTLDELQEKTEKLIEDKKLWESFSKNAKKRAADFSEKQFCESVQKLIQ